MDTEKKPKMSGAQKLAAGMIVFRLNFQKQIEYLMMQTSYGINHWTPPKGHLDEGETDLQAAIRETEEEAGLMKGSDYELIDEKQTVEANYEAFGKPKRVVYWIAQLKPEARQVRLSHEHKAFKWATLSEAIELAKFETLVKNLNDADDIVKRNLSSTQVKI